MNRLFQMKHLIVPTFLVVALFLGGCGPTVSVQKTFKPTVGDKFMYSLSPKVEVSEEALSILRQQLDSQLQAAAVLGGAADANKSVEISIKAYSMRHGAARALVGAMAGSDNIQSSVVIKDKTSQSIVGEFLVESKNSSAMGTAQGLITDHVTKIVEYLKSGRI